MALQLYKDSKEISSDDVIPDSNTLNGNESHSSMTVQEAESINNRGTRLHTNEKKSLQTLLNLSTSLQQTEGTTGGNNTSVRQIDKEKELFLKDCLNKFSPCNDFVENLKNLIGTIANSTKFEENEEEYETTLEILFLEVGCIDAAKCFYQLGGLEVVKPLLKHKKNTIRGWAARIIGESCQNNPFCQDLTIRDGVFSTIIEVAKLDDDFTTRFYAFSAISAIVRGNTEALHQFQTYNGFDLLRDALKLGDRRIIAKVSFFIEYLSQLELITQGAINVKSDLMYAGIVPALMEAAFKDHSGPNPGQALCFLMNDYPGAIHQGLEDLPLLREHIVRTIDNNSGLDGDHKLLECCETLLKQIDDIKLDNK